MSFIKRLKSKFRRMGRSKRILIITVLILLLTASVAGAVGIWYFNYLGDYEGRLIPPNVSWPGQDVDGQPVDVSEAFNEKVINLVLLGFDRTRVRDEIYDYYRPDSIMVVAINLETSEVDMVSIPRDSLVSIYNQGGARDKINASYYWGWDSKYSGLTDPAEMHASGLNSVVQTVSMTLKIPIHYWVAIDMDGVAEAVDIMGGVWYDVETNIRTKDGRVLVAKGHQKLNGRNFVWYVRNRSLSGGDFQRARNQQNILIEAFNQFKQADKLMKVPEVYMSMRNNVDTNLTVEQMASLALFATREVKSSGIRNHGVIVGSSAMGRLSESWVSSVYYYIINPTQLAQLVKDIWGVTIKPDPRMTVFPSLPGEVVSDDSDHDIPSDLEPSPDPNPDPDPDSDPEPDPEPDPDQDTDTDTDLEPDEPEED